MIERSIQLLACEFHVSADAENRGVSPGPEAAGALVERRLHELAFGALGDCTKVHAGCGTRRGRRFLIVGNGRAGKTTLMTRVLFALYGLSEEEMNKADFLSHRAIGSQAIWNQHREPLLTYVHAYKLYRSRTFQSFRRQYPKVYRHHIHLRPSLAQEIDGFIEVHFPNDSFTIGAHVRHPSHTVEQPNAIIGHATTYIDRIFSQLKARGIDQTGDGWRVFLATDQERVVKQFREVFGDRVVYCSDVRRTEFAEDDAFDKLSATERNQTGHQLQHRVAASPDKWSSRIAWEVVRDAVVMSRCNVLLHVVSNVSTAVSYMNPDLELFARDRVCCWSRGRCGEA